MKRSYYITIVDNKIVESPSVYNIIANEENFEKIIQTHLNGWQNLSYATLSNEKMNSIQIAGSQKVGNKIFSILITNHL